MTLHQVDFPQQNGIHPHKPHTRGHIHKAPKGKTKVKGKLRH